VLILQAIIDGVLVGGFYALMAAGLTLVFGVMEIVNFAQGVLVVLGAYLSYALYSHFHIDPFLGLLVTIPAMFIIGMIVYWTLIKPIKQDRVIMSLLVMFAVGTVIEGVLDVLYQLFGPARVAYLP
jgi:branched-chain amino acid transport system permease protein